MTNFGKLIRMKRKAKGESIADVAKKLKISEDFVRHLESSRIVPVSPRLVEALSKHYRTPLVKLERLAKDRNRVAKAYYRNLRKAA